MIRHVPKGRGHAYRPSLDQRIPVVPTVDDPIEIRALLDEHLHEAWVEVRREDGTRERHPADLRGTRASSVEDATGRSGDEGGHLAAAAAAGEAVTGMHPATITLAPLSEPIRYRWVAGTEATDWFDLTPARWCTDVGVLQMHGSARDRLVGDVQWLVDATGPRRCRLAFALGDDEHVVGLGERFHALDHRGHTIDTVVFEQYKDQGERTYLPVPFALVVGGPSAWGLYVETTRRCWFDVGASNSDLLVIEVALDPDDPVVAVDVFTGTPPNILDQFLDTTARPATVPSWVFRPWMSSNEWNTQDRVVREVQRSLDEDIAVGVIVIEAWADEATFTSFRDAQYGVQPGGDPLGLADFTFPPDGAWPDPAGLVAWLHDNGIRVLLWQIPILPVDVPENRQGAVQLAHDRAVLVAGDHAVLEADGTPYHNRGWWFPGGLLPDFTSPEATAWWVDKRRWLVEDLGIDGFKTDGGEHAWGDELRYADGSRGDETNNRYSNLYAQAYRNLLADAGRDGVTFSRAGFTGAGALACHWAGDQGSTWEAYRAAITAGLSAGVSGVFAWGWDLAGFSGEIPDAELYLRSTAMAALCPIMQYHSEYNHHREPSRDRTPWNIAESTGEPTVLSTYREFAHLRERLVNYLDEQYHRGVEVGLPLMRTLALQWPQHDEVWTHPYQYMLGDDLLVAPVTSPAGTGWWCGCHPVTGWMCGRDNTTLGTRPSPLPRHLIASLSSPRRWRPIACGRCSCPRRTPDALSVRVREAGRGLRRRAFAVDVSSCPCIRDMGKPSSSPRLHGAQHGKPDGPALSR